MKAPTIVSGDGSGPSGQGRQRGVPNAHLEERRGEARLDLVEVEVQLVRSNADEADVEDQVGIGGGGQRVDEGRLAGHGARVDLALLEARLADLALLDLDRPRAVPLVELDQEHLAGSVLVQGHGLGRAGVGVGDRAGPTRLGRVPVARARGSRAWSRRSRRS